MRPGAVGVEAAEHLAAVHALAFQRPWSAAEFARLLQEPGAFAFATSDGFILIRALGPEAEVLTLAVSPSARRRGVGRALLEAALARAAEDGVELVFLEVAADNRAALALYDRAGFARVGARRGYYPRGDGAAADALTLRLALRPALPRRPG